MAIPIDFSKLQPQDILDIAAFIEQEAQERYEYFADHLGRQGDAESAEFFRLMATLEGVHGAQVGARRERRFAGLPAHLRDVVEWDVEGPPLDHGIAALSLEAALEMAIASERRARDFFAEAQEHLTDKATQSVLAELHRDEVGHIAMLEDQRARLVGP
jgi:rubrerythrin